MFPNSKNDADIFRILAKPKLFRALRSTYHDGNICNNRNILQTSNEKRSSATFANLKLYNNVFLNYENKCNSVLSQVHACNESLLQAQSSSVDHNLEWRNQDIQKFDQVESAVESKWKAPHPDESIALVDNTKTENHMNETLLSASALVHGQKTTVVLADAAPHRFSHQHSRRRRRRLSVLQQAECQQYMPQCITPCNLIVPLVCHAELHLVEVFRGHMALSPSLSINATADHKANRPQDHTKPYTINIPLSMPKLAVELNFEVDQVYPQQSFLLQLTRNNKEPNAVQFYYHEQHYQQPQQNLETNQTVGNQQHTVPTNEMQELLTDKGTKKQFTQKQLRKAITVPARVDYTPTLDSNQVFMAQQYRSFSPTSKSTAEDVDLDLRMNDTGCMVRMTSGSYTNRKESKQNSDERFGASKRATIVYPLPMHTPQLDMNQVSILHQHRIFPSTAESSVDNADKKNPKLQIDFTTWRERFSSERSINNYEDLFQASGHKAVREEKQPIHLPEPVLESKIVHPRAVYAARLDQNEVLMPQQYHTLASTAKSSTDDTNKTDLKLPTDRTICMEKLFSNESMKNYGQSFEDLQESYKTVLQNDVEFVLDNASLERNKVSANNDAVQTKQIKKKKSNDKSETDVRSAELTTAKQELCILCFTCGKVDQVEALHKIRHNATYCEPMIAQEPRLSFSQPQLPMLHVIDNPVKMHSESENNPQEASTASHVGAFQQYLQMFQHEDEEMIKLEASKTSPTKVESTERLVEKAPVQCEQMKSHKKLKYSSNEKRLPQANKFCYSTTGCSKTTAVSLSDESSVSANLATRYLLRPIFMLENAKQTSTSNFSSDLHYCPDSSLSSGSDFGLPRLPVNVINKELKKHLPTPTIPATSFN